MRHLTGKWPSRYARGGSAAVLAVALAGCSQPSVEPNLNSPVPEERILGLVESARNNDPKAAPQYIQMLDSQDPALRMFAIGALKRLTGETMGYHYGDPEPIRAAAVDRWVAWLGDGGAAALPPRASATP